MRRRLRFDSIKRAFGLASHLADQRADTLNAALVVGLPVVDGSGDLGMHGCAAEFFCGVLGADGCLHQRGTSEEESAAFRHENGVAHDWKISASSHAHAHDGSDLRDAHGRHHSIVAKDPAKIVGIGKYIFL